KKKNQDLDLHFNEDSESSVFLQKKSDGVREKVGMVSSRFFKKTKLNRTGSFFFLFSFVGSIVFQHSCSIQERRGHKKVQGSGRKSLIFILIFLDVEIEIEEEIEEQIFKIKE